MRPTFKMIRLFVMTNSLHCVTTWLHNMTNNTIRIRVELQSLLFVPQIKYTQNNVIIICKIRMRLNTIQCVFPTAMTSSSDWRFAFVNMVFLDQINKIGTRMSVKNSMMIDILFSLDSCRAQLLSPIVSPIRLNYRFVHKKARKLELHLFSVSRLWKNLWSKIDTFT